MCHEAKLCMEQIASNVIAQARGEVKWRAAAHGMAIHGINSSGCTASQRRYYLQLSEVG